MDKRGVKIVVGCIISTLIVFFIFTFAVNYGQSRCELIIIEQQLLREQTLNNWIKMKPLKSNDKSIIFKMAAYLEFHMPPDDELDGQQQVNKLDNNNNNIKQLGPTPTSAVNPLQPVSVPTPNLNDMRPPGQPNQLNQQNQQNQNVVATPQQQQHGFAINSTFGSPQTINNTNPQNSQNNLTLPTIFNPTNSTPTNLTHFQNNNNQSNSSNPLLLNKKGLEESSFYLPLLMKDIGLSKKYDKENKSTLR